MGAYLAVLLPTLVILSIVIGFSFFSYCPICKKKMRVKFIKTKKWRRIAPVAYTELDFYKGYLLHWECLNCKKTFKNNNGKFIEIDISE